MRLTTSVGLSLACVAAGFAGPVALAQPAVAPPINNWSYQRHSSTAAEGYLRGSAAAIEAAGQASYFNSLAAVNYQEARRRAIENNHLFVTKYFENRELKRQFREKYASIPPTKEQWARITEASLPDRLKPEEFDPVTGQLVWPHILRGDEYKPFRDRIDELFANRTPDDSGDGSPSQRSLAKLIDGMKMLLKENIDTVTASQYGAAKWFLLSLEYEALLPMQGVPVADTAVPPSPPAADDDSSSNDATANAGGET